eukprot:m.78291 g.78291  ORF g.78291 m.78291 type:complete len:362 (+) comp25101_c0_seq2:86-1171(+)
MALNWFADVFGHPEAKEFRKNQSLFKLTEQTSDTDDVVIIPGAGTSWRLTSTSNNKAFAVGQFETPSLEQLRLRTHSLSPLTLGSLKFANISGDVGTMHRDPKNRNAVFQAASQFNCLEMVGPGVSPESGISQYALDKTQGPACALACPAATLFRNYFVLSGKGQTTLAQIDTLADVAQIVDNDKHGYWTMRNGYCLPTKSGTIAALSNRLLVDADLAARCRAALRVGVHWSTEVTSRVVKAKTNDHHCVCQVYCSALPVAYATKTAKSLDWPPFAAVVLEATYEAVLHVALVLAHERNTRIKVYLTCVGGGVFGNRTNWIQTAISKALQTFKDAPLDVFLVHYGRIPSSDDWKRLFKHSL